MLRHQANLDFLKDLDSHLFVDLFEQLSSLNYLLQMHIFAFRRSFIMTQFRQSQV